MPKRYFDDFAVGESSRFGQYTVSKDEITEFAQQYDPQPFHVDQEAAAESPFGELIASGWHSAAICMRLVVDNYFAEGSLGSPGVENLKWRHPVKPGDTLSVQAEVLDKRELESKPDQGIVHIHFSMSNENEEEVLSMEGSFFFPRSPEPTD